MYISVIAAAISPVERWGQMSQLSPALSVGASFTRIIVMGSQSREERRGNEGCTCLPSKYCSLIHQRALSLRPNLPRYPYLHNMHYKG